MHILVKILVFSLPLACSHLPELFWLWNITRINGNYELFKVLYFNIFSSLIILLYSLSYIYHALFSQKSIRSIFARIPQNTSLLILWFFCINIIAALTSISPFESLIWWTQKGHGMLMFNNLIGIFCIISTLKLKQVQGLISSFLYSISIVCIIGIWQYYIPSFDYWALGTRAISTLGHPNYLSGLILMSIVFLLNSQYIVNIYLRYTMICIIVFCLILSFSYIAIALSIWYILYRICKKYQLQTLDISLIYLVLFILCAGLIWLHFPEKIHSLVSRYYIWKTSIDIIVSQPLGLFTWFWHETLPHYFDTFKSPYLYLFENFGFRADRPHNIFIYFLYTFWLLGLGFISFLGYFIYRHVHTLPGQALGLVWIFLLCNYASIATYLIGIIVIISLYWSSSPSQKTYHRFISYGLYLCVSIISCYTLYTSIALYQAERSITLSWSYQVAYQQLPHYYLYQYKNDVFTHAIESEIYYLERLYSSDQYQQNCWELVWHFPSAENYFYCWDLFASLEDIPLSHDYYAQGIQKLPDIWQSDSLYWDHPIVSSSISGNRFYAPQYSPIARILSDLDITIER